MTHLHWLDIHYELKCTLCQGTVAGILFRDCPGFLLNPRQLLLLLGESLDFPAVAEAGAAERDDRLPVRCEGGGIDLKFVR